MRLLGKIVSVILVFLMLAVLLPAVGAGNASMVGTDVTGNSTRAGPNDYTMYFHNTSSANYVFDYSTPYIFNTTLGNKSTNIWDQQRVRMNFLLAPVLAADFQCTGTVSTVIYISTKGVSANANLYVDIFDVEAKDAGSETSTKVYSGTGSGTITSGIDSYQIDVSDNPHTFLAGHSIRVYIEIQGGASAEFGLWYGDPKNDSRITFNAQETLNIPSIATKDYANVNQVNFDLDVSDKTVKMQATVTDVFGGYDVNDVWCSLYDPDMNIVLANVSMDKISGTPITFSNVFEATWDYTSAPVGEYTLYVWAVDNNGYYHWHHKQNYNFGPYKISAQTTFFVGGLPTNGYVTVEDSMNVPLVNARVEAHRAGKMVFYDYTDADGIAEMGIYMGLHDIIVIWQDIVVKTESNYNVADNFSLTLVCDVFYPEFEVVDHNGEPMVGANVYMKHPNGSYRIKPFITDADGLFNITQAPIGSYELIVKWRDVEVAVETHPVNKNGYIATIICDVFTLEITAVDSRDLGLAGAQMIIADSESQLILDSRISDLGGYFKSQLPIGDFTISIYWRQRKVQEFDLSLIADHTETVSCWVYYVNFKALDPHNVSVENAQVVMTLPETGGVLDSQMTNLNGTVESRLPIGLVDIDVYWKEALVNSTRVEISGDVDIGTPLELICEIYYLTLKAVDSKDVPIAEASIRIERCIDCAVIDTKKTDNGGETVVRLPTGDYDIYVDWVGVEVYNESALRVNMDFNKTLDCNVFYLEVKALDDRALAVEGASINIMFSSSGEIYDSGFTAEAGIVESRIPIGSYDIDIYWLGVLVFTEDGFFVDKDQTSEKDCDIFYLTVNAEDKNGEGVDDVLVMVDATEYNIVASQYSEGGGKTEFRLPMGEYLITGRLQKTYMLKEVDQSLNETVDLSSSQEMTFEFSEYPPSIFTTPVFWVVFAIIVFLIILIILIVLIVKARSKTTAAPEEDTPPPPPEDEDDIVPPPPEDEEDELEGPDGPPPPEDEEMPDGMSEEDLEKDLTLSEEEAKDLEIDDEPGEAEAPEDTEGGEPAVDEESPVKDESPVDDAPPGDDVVGDEAPPEEPKKE